MSLHNKIAISVVDNFYLHFFQKNFKNGIFLKISDQRNFRSDQYVRFPAHTVSNVVCE